MEDMISKINQLLAGINCEVNRQARIYGELEASSITVASTTSYQAVYPKYLEEVYNTLSKLHDDVCEFSNAKDVNDDLNINFNNCIIDNLKLKSEE